MNQQFDGQKEGFKIDLKRIGYRVQRYWYLVLLSLGMCLGVAYFKNRYSPKIYPVTASVIIREKEEASGADLLYKNSLIEGYRNYLNEPYIIKSYPLIGNVIKKLNFEVVFINEGTIKVSEVYKLPVKVRLLKRNGSYGASLFFKVLNENTYSVKNATEKSDEKERVFYFSDSVEFGGHHFVVFKDSLDDVKRISNMPYKLTFLDPKSVTENYVGRLNVQWAEEGSGVLNLSINGSNPDKEIDFINGLITTYQQYDLEKKNQTAERTIQFIKKQLAEISDSLKISEAQLEQFKISNSSEKLDDEAKRLFDKLAPLESQRSELVIRANYYAYLINYISKGDNLDLIVLPSAVGVNDAILNGLVEKMINSQLELKLFLGKGKDENPLARSGVRRLDELKKDLMQSVKTLKTTDNLRAELIRKEISDLEKLIDHLPVAQRQFISIQRNYTLLDNLYIFLMQKMSEAGISKASNVSDIVPVNPPMKGTMISPNTSQNYFFGWAIGLLIPSIVFVLLEFFNQKIQSKEDLDKITSIPFIGGIGHHQTKDNLAVGNRPKSAVAESFRAIRSNLSFFTANQTKKVFMVSSSISGEGKTFSTINLATVFAMSNRKTLIIGADLRKPKIFSDFGLTNDRGLSGYLSRLNTLTEIIQHTPIDNLDLISGGPVPPNPSELLLNEQIGNLIEEALKLYDYIIIDTPPMAIVTDAFVLSKYADHTIFITRQNFTPKGLLRDVQSYYDSGKLKNISIVLNDIYKSGMGYGYGYGYGYGKKSDGYGYYS